MGRQASRFIDSGNEMPCLRHMDFWLFLLDQLYQSLQKSVNRKYWVESGDYNKCSSITYVHIKEMEGSFGKPTLSFVVSLPYFFFKFGIDSYLYHNAAGDLFRLNKDVALWNLMKLRHFLSLFFERVMCCIAAGENL